jgi:hypothetical protein
MGPLDPRLRPQTIGPPSLPPVAADLLSDNGRGAASTLVVGGRARAGEEWRWIYNFLYIHFAAPQVKRADQEPAFGGL